jgi:hypothetical protein
MVGLRLVVEMLGLYVAVLGLFCYKARAYKFSALEKEGNF